jgi:hypothetical protein
MTALVGALSNHEFFGRSLCHMDIERFSDVAIAFLDPPRGPAGPHLPLGGELTIPALVDADGGYDAGPELARLTTRWSYELSRYFGLAEFEWQTRDS